MIETIRELEKEMKTHEVAAKRCRDAIRALHACCPHTERVDDGHDSHQKYVRCLRCGKRW